MAAQGDFWLDEVWSWVFAGQIGGYVDVITKLKHDNNHFLNTWAIFTLGPDADHRLYRLPSIIAGVLTIAVAPLMPGSPRTNEGKTTAAPKRQRLILVALTAASHLFIHYSSEARGYGALILFCCVLFVLASKLRETNSWTYAAAMGLVSCTGFLSHLTFLYCFSATSAWLAVDWILRFQKRESNRMQSLLQFCLATLPGVAMLGTLYWLNIRDISIGGGDPASSTETVGAILSLIVGGPASGLSIWFFALITTAVGIRGAYLLCKEDHTLAVFFLTLILMPFIVLAWRPVEAIYPRYFLVYAPFVLLAFSRSLSHLWMTDATGRFLAVLAIASFVGLNGYRVSILCSIGRGGYSDAIVLMKNQTDGNRVTVGSDHDFRNKLPLMYAARRLRSEQSVEYYDMGSWPAEGTQWLLVHDQGTVFHPNKRLTISPRLRYQLVQVFPYAGLSGWHWAVYKRSDL